MPPIAATSERFTVSAFRPTRRAGAPSRGEVDALDHAVGRHERHRADLHGRRVVAGADLHPGRGGQAPADVLQQPALTDSARVCERRIKVRLSALSCGG